MTMYKNLTTVCAAVVLAFGLAACGGGDDDDTAMTEPVVEEPMEPAPDPGPTDLETTQADAAAAAAAAMTASDNAAASAMSAMEATATLATLQTGADSNADEMGGNESAYAAHKAAMDAAAAASDAATASAAAAAATTGTEAEAAKRMALDAQDAAEAAEATAATMSMAAIEAAMTELHIDGTVKTVGESSLDASMGELRTKTAGGGLMITGTQLANPDLDALTTRTTAAEDGVAFAQRDADATPPTTVDTPYKQAIKEGTITIGKVVDTSDDMARLTIITARQGKKTVRVFTDGPVAEVQYVVGAATAATETTPEAGGALAEGAGPAQSIGLYYEATPPDGDTTNALDAMDEVTVTKAKGVEVFELGADSEGNPVYARIVLTETRPGSTTPVNYYRRVDIIADAGMTDGPDENGDPDDLTPVTVSIPVAE